MAFSSLSRDPVAGHDGHTILADARVPIADRTTAYVESPRLSGICPLCKSVLAPEANYCFICRQGFEPPEEEWIEFPDLGPDFRLRYHLGRGGMGRIYVAEDSASRLIVIKTILDERLSDRFHVEAQSIARLNHPNIVTVHLFRPEPPGPYLVMEFCRDGTLRHLITRQKGPCTEHWLVENARHLLEALGHAHEHGLVHRDISPENVLFQGAVPKLADFGLACDFEASHMTRTGQFMGKLQYAAPEQVEDASRVDIRADLFSLGATLYFAATGRSPYPVIDLSRVPRTAAPLIEALTKIDPVDRPRDPKAALSLLEEVQGARPISMRRVTAARVSLTACSDCGFAGLEATPDAPFCPMCGQSQFWKCPGCDRMTQVGVPFCKHCGLAVAQCMELRRSLQTTIADAEEGRLYESLRGLFELRRLLQQELSGGDSRSEALLRDLALEIETWYDFLEAVWRDRWDAERLSALAAKVARLAPHSRVLGDARRELAKRQYASIHPAIPGFTLDRFETFACASDAEGRQEATMAVYRCNALAEAIGASGHAIDSEFVLLPRMHGPVSFRMGSPDDEPERRGVQESLRKVRFTHHYLLARTTVTRRVHAATHGKPIPTGAEGLLPATGLACSEASEWCRQFGLDLPSEPEWEFACRGQTQGAFHFGRRITPDQVNFDGRKPYVGSSPGPFRDAAVPVGSLPGNAFGLHEMHGNVWEWTRNQGESGRHGRAEPFNVLRGGAFDSPAALCRSAQRSRLVDLPRGLKTCGVRPVKVLPELPCQGPGI